MTEETQKRLQSLSPQQLIVRQIRQHRILVTIGYLTVIIGFVFFISLFLPIDTYLYTLANRLGLTAIARHAENYILCRHLWIPLFVIGLVASVCLVKYPDTLPQLYQDQLIQKSISHRASMMRNLVSHYLFRLHNYALGMFVLCAIGFYFSLNNNSLRFSYTGQAIALVGYLLGTLYICLYLYYQSLYTLGRREPPFPIHLYKYIQYMMQKKPDSQKSAFVHQRFDHIDTDKLFSHWTEYITKQIASVTTYASEFIWQWISAQWLTFTCRLYRSHDFNEMLSMYNRVWQKVIKSCSAENAACFARFILIQVDEECQWSLLPKDLQEEKRALLWHIALVQCSLISALTENTKLGISDIIPYSKLTNTQEEIEKQRILHNAQRFILCGWVYEVNEIVNGIDISLSDNEFTKLYQISQIVRTALLMFTCEPNLSTDLYGNSFIRACLEVLNNADLEPFNSYSHYLQFKEINIPFLEKVLRIKIC